jgi:hypothetical protein
MRHAEPGPIALAGAAGTNGLAAGRTPTQLFALGEGLKGGERTWLIAAPPSPHTS